MSKKIKTVPREPWHGTANWQVTNDDGMLCAIESDNPPIPSFDGDWRNVGPHSWIRKPNRGTPPANYKDTLRKIEDPYVDL